MVRAATRLSFTTIMEPARRQMLREIRKMILIMFNRCQVDLISGSRRRSSNANGSGFEQDKGSQSNVERRTAYKWICNNIRKIRRWPSRSTTAMPCKIQLKNSSFFYISKPTHSWRKWKQDRAFEAERYHNSKNAEEEQRHKHERECSNRSQPTSNALTNQATHPIFILNAVWAWSNERHIRKPKIQRFS